METSGFHSRTPHTSSSSRTTQSSSYYYYHSPVKFSSIPPMPGSPEGGLSGSGGHYSENGGGSECDRQTSRPSSDCQSGSRSAHYEDFGYHPPSTSRYYYDEVSRHPPQVGQGYHYYDTPRGDSYDQGRQSQRRPMGYPTYTAPPNNYDGREKDGIDEIERAAEQRMQEAATMIVPLHRPQYRFPSNSPMLKMFRVYLEKQLNDTKLGAVLTEVSLPAAAEDEYGAGLRVKTVLEAAEIGETGLLARWNEKARPLDRDVRVGDVIVSVLDGSAVESLGPEASSRKLMDKLKKSVKFNSLIILDVLREAPPLEVCDWPQTQQTIIACLERMEKNFIERKDQAMTWFVGDVAPIILSPSSHLWCPLCECKQQTLTAYLAHFDSPEHLEKRRVTSSKFDSRWAKLPIGISKYYWFEYCYGFTSIVDPSEGDPYCEFCDYSPIGS